MNLRAGVYRPTYQRPAPQTLSDIVRAISVYDDRRLFVTSNFHLDPSQMQLPLERRFHVVWSRRHGDIMILRTPIISELFAGQSATN